MRSGIQAYKIFAYISTMTGILAPLKRLFGLDGYRFDISSDTSGWELDPDFSQPYLPEFEDLFYVDNPINPEDPKVFGLPVCSKSFNDPLGKTIVDRTIQHRNKFRGDVKGKKLIAVVHPFYLFITQSYELCEEEYHKEVKRYLNNLCTLLSGRRRDEYDLVFLSIPTHYAAFEGGFLEAGIVDDVLFTEKQQGKVLESESDKTVLTASEVVVAGGYVRGCFGTFLGRLLEHAQGDVRFAPELVLPRPDDEEGLDTQMAVYKRLTGCGIKARSLRDLCR